MIEPTLERQIAIQDGFFLGVRMAEELHGLAQNSTIYHESFTPLLLAIASGDTTLIESAAELDLPPEAGNPNEERYLLNASIIEAARSLIVRLTRPMKGLDP